MTSPASASLNPRLAEWTSYANAIRYQLLEFVQSLPESDFDRRLSADDWTITGILEHLALIEDSIGRMINRMTKQIRADGHPAESDASSILGMLDEFAAVDNSRKLISPEPYRPTGSLTAHQAIAKLEEVRARVLGAVEAANGIDLTHASFPHPFFGPLTGYQWLVLIAQHEFRHLKQMKEIVSAPPAAMESR
ncbi:MAG: DinB family protein [Phycisphaerae bacterium]|nr:DinB family protein [Gemmatimonadaceae bacterium]